MGNRVRADQSGAKDSGLAITGSSNRVQSGGFGEVRGNVTYNGGIDPELFSSVLGQTFKASPAAALAATPPALTPNPATPAASKAMIYAVGIVGGLAVSFLVFKLISKFYGK